MQRRALLTSLPALATAPWATRLWAAPAADARLLVVFLRGGYDALTLLVPQRGFYAEARPQLAVTGADALDADWALHPALRASLLPLVRAGQAHFVPFAGTDDVTRSHFETQDTVELGQPVGGPRDLRSGFLNRLAGVLGGGAPIAFTDQMPLVLRGPAEAANLSLRGPARPGDDRLQPAIAAMYRQHPLQAKVDEAFALRDEAARQMAREMDSEKAGEMAAANRNAISTRGFEAEARRVGLMMRERHALGFIDVGGWDTHVGQGGTTGPLATRLDELARGLVAYADALGPAAWRRTVVVVLSEFGRTVRENGARGTDHGHGSVYWVLGGSLSGPAIAGEQSRIEASTLFQGRDLPVLNDCRSVLGGLMARQFALSSSALDTVFPSARPRDLGLL